MEATERFGDEPWRNVKITQAIVVPAKSSEFELFELQKHSKIALILGRDDDFGALNLLQSLMLLNQTTSEDKKEKPKDDRKKLEPVTCLDLEANWEDTYVMGNHSCESRSSRERILLRSLVTSERKRRVTNSSWQIVMPVRP